MSAELTPEARIALGPDRTQGPLHWVLREEVLSAPYLSLAEVEESPFMEGLGPDAILELATSGAALAVQDHGDSLFPRFQFNPNTSMPYRLIQSVYRSTRNPHNQRNQPDNWSLAHWWARRNYSLQGTPANRLHRDEGTTYSPLPGLARDNLIIHEPDRPPRQPRH